jgi:hypothetical protein
MYPCYLLHENKRLESSKQSRFSIIQFDFWTQIAKACVHKNSSGENEIVEIIRGRERTNYD